MSAAPIEHALVLAAGRGNRMRPLTDRMPKALVPYKGDTLIGNSLRMLQSQVKHIHVTVGYKSVRLAEYLLGVGVSTIINTEGQSNAWWIHNSLLAYVDDPVLVLTCDNITELDMQFINTEYYDKGAPACMLVPVAPVPMIEGDFISQEKGLVKSIQREKPTEMYCSGIQVLNPHRVSRLAATGGDFYSIWSDLMKRQGLKASALYPKKWFSVDTLEQLAKANGEGQ